MDTIYLLFCLFLACSFLFLFFIFCSVFVWFWYQGDGGFIEWFWECSILFHLLEEFEKDWCKFCFVCLVEFPCEAVQSWTFVCRQFFKLQVLFNF